MKTNYLVLILSVTLFCCTTKDSASKTESYAPKDTATTTVPILTADQQMTAALFAVPSEGRADAKIYGYNANNELVALRGGDGNFICIADNPKKDGFQVVAYHTSLEPIMSRGRTLNSEGKSRKEKEEIRSSEAKSGILKLPEAPATLHIYYGKDGFFNTKTDSIENAKYRYVVYIPYATQESTGLSLSPNESSHPWLMFPGKYNTHIMITPEK